MLFSVVTEESKAHVKYVADTRNVTVKIKLELLMNMIHAFNPSMQGTKTEGH